MIKFTVPGEPTPKARPRVTRYGTYTPKKTAAYEKLVRQCWSSQSGEKTDGAVSLTVKCYMPIPKSLSRKRRAELVGKPHTKKPDLDNLIKAVADGINGFAYDDDSSVCEIVGVKLYSTEPRTEVEIRDFQ